MIVRRSTVPAAAPAAAAWALSILLAGLAGCSGGAQPPPPLEAGPPACPGDAGASTCWAVGRLTTKTGCADTHCDRDGGRLMRTADYTSCGITPPDPANNAPVDTGLASAEGALSLYDDLCEFRAIVVPSCGAGPRSLFFESELTTIDGAGVPAGADPYIEAYSSFTHPAPSTGGGMEMATGRYRIGPVTFDMPGTWTVVLHYFGMCRDSLPMSPHGHVTMSIEVP